MSVIFGELLTFGQANGPDIKQRAAQDERHRGRSHPAVEIDVVD